MSGSDSDQSRDPAGERVIELEVRMAYQDKLIGDLDEVVRQFSVRVEQLERQVKELRERIDDGADVGPHDEKPPHY